MTENDEKLVYLRKCLKSYMDFPKPNINFWDVFSLYSDALASKYLNELVISKVKSLSPKPQCVVGLEARGFLLGPVAALALDVPFFPIRKKGKLPGKTQKVSYTLEYGEDILEIQENYINQGTTALIVDDLLATGGSVEAACNLLKKVKAIPTNVLVIMELTSLNGRKKIPNNIRTDSLLQLE